MESQRRVMLASSAGASVDETAALPFPARPAALRPRPRPQPAQDDRAARDQWVVVLAGGNGRRIRSFTTTADGRSVPKQFCRFRDERTLLAATLDRAMHVTSSARVLVVVQEAHRPWWEAELGRVPAANVIAQTDDRGTAIAILQALVEIHTRDRSPRLVVMPCDADVDDETVLLRSIGGAQWTARGFPEDVVLLGVVPSHIDPEYGLIVPSGAGAGRRVRSFVEKPLLTVARRLMRAGAMWNSFIFACNGWALYDLFTDALPDMTNDYLRRICGSDGGAGARARVVAAMPSQDFGHDVLQRGTHHLRLVPVPTCGWTGLGTPGRLAAWLDRHRDAMFWREHRLKRLGNDGAGGAARPA